MGSLPPTVFETAASAIPPHKHCVPVQPRADYRLFHLSRLRFPLCVPTEGVEPVKHLFLKQAAFPFCPRRHCAVYAFSQSGN